MWYWVYGPDAATSAPRDPLFIEADSEETARIQARELGMRAEKCELAQPRPAPAEPPTPVATRSVSPTRPSSSTVLMFAICSCGLGLVGGAWLGVNQGEVGGFVIGGLTLIPFIVLAAAATWPWTTRAGLWVLGVAIAMNSLIGVMMALDAPYSGLRTLEFLGLWLAQCVVTVLALVIELLLWFVARWRAAQVKGNTSGRC